MTLATAPQVRYKLSRPQKAVFTSDARFRVVIAGRRGGKSYLAVLCLLHEAMKGERKVCWYIAPTYRQGKEILWALLKRLVPPEYIAGTNETDLSMRLINGSLIAIRGADNPNSLRGVGLDFVALDEFAFMDRGIWHEAVRPMLSDTLGRAMFITTPNGMGWDYDLYLMGKERRDGFESWTWTTLEGANVAASEVEAARSMLPPRLFRQEYEASFEVMAGRVYDNFDRTLNVATIEDQPSAELLVGMDFNVNPMSCVVGVKAGECLHILDALEVASSNTEEVAEELERRYPGRRIIVCPDPSGNARKTSAVAGTTDFTILRRHGFQVDVASHAPLIPNRVNAVQAMLLDAAGTRRLILHPRAKALIRALDGLTYKDGTSIPDKTSGLDHMADALGYLIWQRFNLLSTRRASVHILHR